MHRFDYSNMAAVLELAQKLNKAGKILKEGGISLLYHNHNCEFRKVGAGKCAYDVLIEKTNPNMSTSNSILTGRQRPVWIRLLMERLGERMKLYHINDRGTRMSGPGGQILKSRTVWNLDTVI